MTNIELERKKALDFLRGDPHVKLDLGRPSVPVDKELNEGENERKKVTETVEEKNPRLRTEAYLKKIGKL